MLFLGIDNWVPISCDFIPLVEVGNKGIMEHQDFD